MFHLLKSLKRPRGHKRVSHGSHRGFARRLGVEAMEGRWMLSGTALDFTPGDLQPLQIGVQFTVNFQSTVAQLSLDGITTRDDGYVLIGNVVPDGTPTVSRPDYDSVGPDFNGGLDTNSQGALGELFGAGDIGATANFATQGNGGGLRGVIIAPPEIERSSLIVSAKLGGSNTATDQGGLIALQQILTLGNTGLENGESTTKPIATLASLESSSITRVAATTESGKTLSGEWARAMVFETAGGEPVFATRPGEHGGATQPSNQRAGSTTSNGATSYAVPPADQRAAAKTNDGARESADAVSASAVHPTTDGHAFMFASFAGDTPVISSAMFVDGVNLANGASAPSLNEAGGDQADSTAAPLTDAAYAKAFEQFSLRKSAALRDADELDSTSRDSLGVASILMVFALERIVTRNSRRPSPAATAKTVLRPRRVRETFSFPEQE